MRKPNPARFALLAALAVLASCTGDQPNPLAPTAVTATRDAGSKVDVCHKPAGADARILEVSRNAMATHIDHGDYVTSLYVDEQGTAGDGVHFNRISDAVRAASATRRAMSEKTTAACRITVNVAAGTYLGSFYTADETLESLPIFIGVPDITLRGALVMPVDAASRALGSSASGASIIAPDRPMIANQQTGPLAEALVVVSDDAAGYHGDGAIVENFRLRSGHNLSGTTAGGIGIGALRVQNLVVRGIHFEPTVYSAVDFRASTATLATSFGQRLGPGCNLCIAGPGNYQISGNRVIDGGFVGLFLAPVAVRPNFPMGLNADGIVVPAYVAPLVIANAATVSNNDISNHRGNPMGLGAGIRLLSWVFDAPASSQSSVIRLEDNTLRHNIIGLIVDANTTPVASPPRVPGNIDVALAGNAIGPSCRNSLLVSFTRFSRTLGASATQSYLSNSTYRLTLGGDTSWSDAWYDNSMGTGNTLLVDGATIPMAKRIAPSDNPAGCP